MTPGPSRAAGSRWLPFTLVGAAGFVVQIVCLWMLTEGAGVHYLVSAAVALEAAILHNFSWHQRWTWGDRPRVHGTLGRRLARFNLLHGATALCGLAMIAVLVEMVHVHYLGAAVVSIAACAACNFLVSDRAIFTASLATGLLVAAGAGSAAAAQSAAADAAFEQRAAALERRLDEHGAGHAPLWIDRLPPAARDAADTALRHGEVFIHHAPQGPAGATACADALCHHWAASVLIPGARVDDVVGLMQDYDAYATLYDPAVRRSRLLSRRGDRFDVALRLFTTKVVTVVLDAEYEIHYVRLLPGRVRVDSRSTRIAEVSKPGTAQERLMPAGEDTGFLWRLHTYCLIEERGAGSYLQCESLSLTRRIPTGLGWIVGPFVTSVPKESLAFTLGQLRKALAHGGDPRVARARTFGLGAGGRGVPAPGGGPSGRRDTQGTKTAPEADRLARSPQAAGKINVGRRGAAGGAVLPRRLAGAPPGAGTPRPPAAAGIARVAAEAPAMAGVPASVTPMAADRRAACRSGRTPPSSSRARSAGRRRQRRCRRR